MNAPKIKDSNELFLQLRAFSTQFQCLHELQVEHLKKWPYAVDPNLDSSTAQVDFDNKKLVYLWTFKGKEKLPKDYQHRLQELCKGVRFLLGNDWSVEIQDLFKKESIFSSEQDASGITKKPRKPGRSSPKRLVNRPRKKRSS